MPFGTFSKAIMKFKGGGAAAKKKKEEARLAKEKEEVGQKPW
jgi:hypothetical protein